MRRLVFVVLFGLALLGAGCTVGGIYIPPTLTPIPEQGTYALIETNRGEIRCELRPDAAPRTVDNFVNLANQGWYDGRLFFRSDSSVIQGGSPDDTNMGAIGYTIPAEIGLPHEAGVLAMARWGDEVNPDRESDGSQFYITKVERQDLDGAYTVFGSCVESLQVILSIQVGDQIVRVRIETY